MSKCGVTSEDQTEQASRDWLGIKSREGWVSEGQLCVGEHLWLSKGESTERLFMAPANP